VLRVAGVVAYYYMTAVEKFGGCPQLLRTDCGTENVKLAALQSLLRQTSSTTHMYGTSPANQRIEAWWSHLRRGRTQWWLDLFASFTNSGTFHTGHVLETDCLRFCFMNLLRQDLREAVIQWNTHRIRPSRGARCPAGIPDELFFLPPAPAINCLDTNLPVIDVNLAQVLVTPTICADEDFGNHLMTLCQQHGWSAPANVDEAAVLYRHLQQLI